MGAAYYIVVNSDDPGFTTSIDGKALAKDSSEIDVIAKSLGFKLLSEYFSQSPEDARLEIAGLLGIDDENNLPPEYEIAFQNSPPEVWYEAEHGAGYAAKVAEHIRNEPDSVKNPEGVLYDLEAMASVMEECIKNGLKWHLLVDY